MIKAVTSITANYIYHMMSVGKCGYDNNYGACARKYHDSKDILILEELKKHITVVGGEHSGQLYWICVAVPASIDEDTDMIEYFHALLDLFTEGNLTNNYEKYSMVYNKVFSKFGLKNDIMSFENFYLSYICLKEEIVNILKVYLLNYRIYVDNFWKESFITISTVCNDLNTIFNRNKYEEMWEEKLNTKYKHDNFYVVLCNSIENGPQAIDISCDKDVFFLSDNYLSDISFISHEFGIYLLKDILSETIAFKDLSYYKEVECLAEFFNIKICGESIQCDWYDKYIKKYADIYDRNPNISVKELFLSIIK